MSYLSNVIRCPLAPTAESADFEVSSACFKSKPNYLTICVFATYNNISECITYALVQSLVLLQRKC